MKLIVLKTRWKHIGHNSGFPLGEVLTSVLPSGNVQELPVPAQVPQVPLHTRIARRLRVRLGSSHYAREVAEGNASGSPWARDRHRDAARSALTILEQHSDHAVLLPAAEDEFCADFAGARPGLKRRVFVCFHQPPGWFRLHWRQIHELDSLGGIFCLAEYQANYFRSVCSSPVHLVRHGVRHDFFQPPEDSSLRNGQRLLFVGQWLRDFETLADAMPLVWTSRPDIELDCVVPRFARTSEPVRRLAMDDRVTWHADVSDQTLRGLYQAADLLFLPVLDAVANNAVLEALASGLPVISTDVGGMSEYLPSGAGQLCSPSDARSHADAVVAWLDNPVRRQDAGVTARKSALENYDWRKIGRHFVSSIIRQA